MPHITATNGTELFYDSFGDDTAEPLVLIQGLSAHMLGWHPRFCQRLADANFHVIRFDNRDVGLSQKFPSGGYCIADMADDAAGLIRALEISPSHVVGQSMGGMIAQQLALDHPELVRSLALIYTAPSKHFIFGMDLVEARMDVTSPENREQAAKQYVEAEEPCGSPAYPTDVEWLLELGGQMYDRDPAAGGVDRQLAAIDTSPDRTDALPLMRVPTTIVCGDSDRLIDPAASSALHDAIAGSTLTVFPGMGHNLPEPLWTNLIDLIATGASRGVLSEIATQTRGSLR
ncbi:alpha/beta hydrolase [Rhodococcus erythropolis]|nr:alpha/beta hydrolase [Rhodococcus erythropolis]